MPNLTSRPPELVEDVRRPPKGGKVVEDLSRAFEVVRSLAHGHVAALWGTWRKIGLPVRLGRRPDMGFLHGPELLVAPFTAVLAMRPGPLLGWLIQRSAR